MTHTTTKRIIISRRVKGVGFRYFTLNAAQSHSISVYVRNLNGGALEVLAAGTSRSMELFLDQLRCGPPSSRVDRCEAQPEASLESDLDEFAIR